MHKRLFLFLLTVLIFALPAFSQAEIQEGSFEISPYMGYCTTATSHVFCHKDFYGLRAGYNLTKNWGIEGVFDYVASNAEMLHADILYHLMPEKTFVPFLSAGVGGAHVRPKNGDSYDTVMGNVGVGFKYFFSRNVAFRSDIRGVMTHSQNLVVSAGLTFAFGGKTPKEAVTTPPSPAPAPMAETKPEPKPEQIPPPPPAPKPEPALPPPAQPKEPETLRVILEDVHFDNNKATLTSVAREILLRNIQVMKEHPGVGIEIQGHTSAIGTEGYNMALSVKRANAVKEFLVKEGISADRLTTVGYGKTRLAVPEPKPMRESKEAKINRRVHFEILVK